MRPDWRLHLKRVFDGRTRRAAFDGRTWLALCAAPSSYLVAIALLGTLAVKLIVLPSISGAGGNPWAGLMVCLPDATLLGGVGALLVAGERVALAKPMKLLLWLIRGLTLFIAVFALFNGAYLAVTGDQLTASIIAMGWERLHDASGILAEELRRHRLVILGGLAALIAVPVLARLRLRTASSADGGANGAPNTALPFTMVSAIALVGWLSMPAPSSLPLARLSRSALLTTYVTWFENSVQAMVDGGDAVAIPFAPMIEPGTRQDSARRFNVIMIAIESLRGDHTSLSKREAVKTPNLLAVAQRGAWTDAASTPLPHTTKAMFAAHCGRMPFWQSVPREMSEHVRLQCMPDVLRAAGYATGFFQTAVGAFEDRPRLVRRLGFEHFEGWENIGGEPIGYLASDDLSLAPALDRWIDTLPKERPFMATLLTSATHHPYRLPKGEIERLTAAGVDINAMTREARYNTLVARADQLVGKVSELVERRGLREHTLIVVFGDHGEGFGEKGVRQHDNNYYQEALHIPLVIAGPGVAPQRLNDASLLDVSPTLLDLLGFETAARDPALYGRDALRQWPVARTKYFSCFYDGVCFGYVRGNTKVVVLPELERAIRFEVDSDPTESKALPVDQKSPEMAKLSTIARALQSSREPIVDHDLQFDNGWACTMSDGCQHPKTPPGIFFTTPQPMDCIKGTLKIMPDANRFDITLSMHNICSGSLTCKVRYTTTIDEEKTLVLRPDQTQDLVLQRAATSPEIKHGFNCDFL
jgi:lipoteichoic acid synthase